MAGDWMPHTPSRQLAMAKRWIDMLPEKETEWRMPAGMLQLLGELIQEAEMLQDRANGPFGTKGDAARARTAFQQLVSVMRDIRRRVFFIPPLTEANFIDLGLQPPDTIRTPHIDVPEMVDFVIHLRGIRELLVDFWIQGEAHTTIKRTRKGVDELNLYVVAQGNVTMTNKSKATFRLPTVRETPRLRRRSYYLGNTRHSPRTTRRTPPPHNGKQNAPHPHF